MIPTGGPGLISYGGPQYIAVDSAGNVYFTERSGFEANPTGGGEPLPSNVVFELSNGAITTVATSDQLNEPSGVAVDSSGNLYIADSGNYRILEVSTEVITTVAGGTQNFGGDNGPAIDAQLSAPHQVAVDSAGDLYVADSNNNRIRKVSNGIITTVAGNGTLGFSGDNGPATSAELNGPTGVAVDSAGDLYVADSNNNRIRKVSNGIITTVAGNGAEGFSGDNGLATSAQL
jgi:sugar lactone lactonase YvrE